ncbi:unnamed protein product [Lota lota]
MWGSRSGRPDAGLHTALILRANHAARLPINAGLPGRLSKPDTGEKGPERYKERKKGPEKPGERAGFSPQLQSDNSWGEVQCSGAGGPRASCGEGLLRRINTIKGSRIANDCRPLARPQPSSSHPADLPTWGHNWPLAALTSQPYAPQRHWGQVAVEGEGLASPLWAFVIET